MNNCKSCKHHAPVELHHCHETGGICKSEKITDADIHERSDTMQYTRPTAGDFWTGDDFGCVHWEGYRYTAGKGVLFGIIASDGQLPEIITPMEWAEVE